MIAIFEEGPQNYIERASGLSPGLDEKIAEGKVLTAVETVSSFTDLRFSPQAISFLSDDIILQCYVEIGGQLRRILLVVKMRGSDHSKDIGEYEVTPNGLIIGRRLTGYQRLIGGLPTKLT